MRRILVPLLVAAAACGKEPEPAEPPGVERPERLENGEPAAVTVKHVLVSFEGAQRSQQSRSKEEALQLAYRVLNEAREGGDFDALMKAHSDDPGPGEYPMVNTGVEPRPGEAPRTGMVKAFGDVAFTLRVGQVGFADHDETDSPFGFHVIKRVK